MSTGNFSHQSVRGINQLRLETADTKHYEHHQSHETTTGQIAQESFDIEGIVIRTAGSADKKIKIEQQLLALIHQDCKYLNQEWH